MHKITAILGLSTWTLGGCSQEFVAAKELKDPGVQPAQQEQSVQASSTQQPVGLTALEASWQGTSDALSIRYHAEDNVVVALCAETEDGYETCVAEKADVSQTIALAGVAKNSTYRVTMIDYHGEQQNYGPYSLPKEENWQDVISCASDIKASQLRLEPRGEKLYIESEEELRVIVCDGQDCDETRGFDGFEVDYTAAVSSVIIQDQYGCKADILGNLQID